MVRTLTSSKIMQIIGKSGKKTDFSTLLSNISVKIVPLKRGANP